MANSNIQDLIDFDSTLLKNEMGRSITYYPDNNLALAESVTAIIDMEEDAGQTSGLDGEYQENLADRAIFYIRVEDLTVKPAYMDSIKDDESSEWDVLKVNRDGAFWKVFCSLNERVPY